MTPCGCPFTMASTTSPILKSYMDSRLSLIPSIFSSTKQCGSKINHVKVSRGYGSPGKQSSKMDKMEIAQLEPGRPDRPDVLPESLSTPLEISYGALVW